MTQHKLKRRITDMYKDDYSNEDDCAYYTEIYLKTEADAVIAALEAENERLRAAMTAKIEPWIECAVWEIDSRCLETGAFFNRNQAANIIAAHAPKQEPIDAYCPKCSELLMLPRGTAIKEPSIPVSRLKFAIATSANLRGDQLTNDIIYLIHEAEGEK